MIGKSIVIALVVAVASARAQSSASGFCSSPRPLADCANWVVTESTMEVAVLSTRIRGPRYSYPGNTEFVSVPDFGRRFSFTLGAMTNVSPTTAFGPTATFSGDVRGVSGRGEIRFRRWTGEGRGIDFSGGVTVREETHVEWQKVAWVAGLTTGVAIDLGDVGLTARAEAVPQNSRVATGLLAGGWAGGKAGLLTLVGFGAYVLFRLGAMGP